MLWFFFFTILELSCIEEEKKEKKEG